MFTICFCFSRVGAQLRVFAWFTLCILFFTERVIVAFPVRILYIMLLSFWWWTRWAAYFNCYSAVERLILRIVSRQRSGICVVSSILWPTCCCVVRRQMLFISQADYVALRWFNIFESETVPKLCETVFKHSVIFPYSVLIYLQKCF